MKNKFRFKEFKVYKDSKNFCKLCHDVVKGQIKGKDNNLALQIERAMNSVVLNIAEGSADLSDLEFARFLGISIRSVYEVVAGFDLAVQYELVSPDVNEKIEDDAVDLVKQLSAFRRSLKNNV